MTRNKTVLYLHYTPAAEKLLAEARQDKKKTSRYRLGGSNEKLFTYVLPGGRVVQDEVQFVLASPEQAEVFLCLVDETTGQPLRETLWNQKPGHPEKPRIRTKLRQKMLEHVHGCGTPQGPFVHHYKYGGAGNNLYRATAGADILQIGSNNKASSSDYFLVTLTSDGKVNFHGHENHVAKVRAAIRLLGREAASRK